MRKHFVWLLVFTSALAFSGTDRVIDATIVRNGAGQLKIPTVTPTANKAAVFDASSMLAPSLTSLTELGFLSGVTSSVQSQLGSLTPLTRTIATTSPLSGGGDLSTNRTLSMPAAATAVDGYLTAIDWNTFNSKEPAIASGTTLQYWRGDKTFQALTTQAVAENTNLYYTNARVQAAAKAGTSGQNFYVAKDVGNDANDCSVLKPCATIGAAVTAANAVAAYLKQAVVYIAPPSGATGYSEDVTLSQQGVNLQCGNPVQNSRACLVKGSLTVNLTGTSGGANFVAGSNEVYVNGMVFSTATATALTFSGTTFQRLALVNSYIESTAAGGFTAISATNSGVNGVPSTLSLWDTQVNNSSASNPTISQTNGRVWFFGTQSVIQNANAAGRSIDLSGASSFVANITAITGEANVTDNTASATFNLSTISSGANPCVVTPSSPSTGVITLAYFGCTSSATNSVTGSGVVVPIGAGTRLSSSGDIISTVTQAVLPGFPQGEQQIGAGAVTGTNVLLSLKGGHLKIAQTTAPTVAVNSNAGTGASCSVSNATDSAGRLSLTTGTLATSSGTQCTVTFNKAYGVAPVCVLSPTNANAAANSVTRQIDFPTPSTTVFTINFGIAETAGTAYTWAYHCIETQ